MRTVPFYQQAFFTGPDAPRRVLGVALVCSILFHALLLALNFKFPAARLDSFTQPLEVVLVNSKSRNRPTKADALAQANLEGGGNTEADRRAQSPLPALPQQNEEVALAARHVQQLESQAQEMLTQLRAKQSVPRAETVPRPQRETIEAAHTDLAARSLEMARLEAQISKDWDQYQKLPKRLFVGARTQEYSLARYVDDWRLKVERVGNLNYPEAARQQKIYGNLLLTVSIKADGSLENVEINRSSGSKILDESALRIVRLAAPYAVFPEEVRRKADILSITRTWMFTRADQLVSQ
ncbi:MAG: TonB family protein [Pseudomonadota bacterium]